MAKTLRFSGKICTLACLVLFLALSFLAFPALAGGYVQTNLVSDGFVPAKFTDPNLVNPWGISYAPTGPFWVSNNGTGTSTLYNGAGTPQGLVVIIPPPTGGTGPATPTVQVFNGTSAFNGYLFIFATEDGTISGWKGGTTATLLVDNSAAGAVYKGLALGNNGAGNFLYVANFHRGAIDVFNSNFSPVVLPGSFSDPNLPSGYAPFNVQNLGGSLYVTYALQDATKHDDVPGPGNGYVNVFDLNGNLQRRLISQGPLNSPWGLALAPAKFGTFSNALLVANFGDGRINAFAPLTGNLLGTFKRYFHLSKILSL
ncbi:MAG: TIGR03118 family protein [Deltaproteobacteria bacterium]|nr:TIGR03118 family protein [Deltaproteobacteria bacterium]